MIKRLVRFWDSLSWTSVLIGTGLILGLVVMGAVFREQIRGWLIDFWQSLTLGKILLGIGLFLLTLALNFVVIAIVMVRLPANYFSSHYQQDFLPRSSWMMRWGATIGKNFIGVLLVVAGVIMLIFPGQGVLTILTGLILLDIPGKRPLEARIIKRPTVLAAVNKLREKYGKPPFIVD